MIYKLQRIQKELNNNKVVSIDIGTENVLIYNNKGKQTVVCYSDLKDDDSSKDGLNVYPNVSFDSVLKIAVTHFKSKNFTTRDCEKLIFDIHRCFEQDNFKSGAYIKL